MEEQFGRLKLKNNTGGQQEHTATATFRGRETSQKNYYNPFEIVEAEMNSLNYVNHTKDSIQADHTVKYFDNQTH